MPRIVAGRAKGRRLAVPPEGTRPTSDRAREAMFNTLAATIHLEGARVLDLYAGTGAVGLEALSRGAAQVVLVEKDRRAVEVLRRNVETVGLPGAEIVAGAVRTFIRGEPVQRFDLVFADPPYEHDDAAVAEEARSIANSWVDPDGTIVVERRAGSGALALEGWTFSDRRYGDSVLWYGRRR